MTDTAAYAVKRYAALAAIILVLLASFFGLSYLRKRRETAALTAAAEVLCRLHPQFAAHPLRILGRAGKEVPAGLSFRAVLRASYAERDGLIFFVPITGKYGVYPAVFFYEDALGCVCCGLAGVNALPETFDAYGITAAAVKLHQQKIEALMQRQAK